MYHTAFIDENNDVYVFGNNHYGQCIPNSDQEFIANPTKLDIKAISVACSSKYTIIVTTDGEVYHYGKIQFSTDQVKKIKICKKVVSAYCSDTNVLLVTEDNEVYGYGSNSFYQLSDKKDYCYQDNPFKLEIIDPISIGCGSGFIVYINMDQDVFVMGNQHGCPSTDPIMKLQMKAARVLCGENDSVLFTKENDVYLRCKRGLAYIKHPFKAIHASFCRNYVVFILENFDLYGMGHNEHVTNIIYKQEHITGTNYYFTPYKAIYTISGTNHLIIVNENEEIFVGGSNDLHQLEFNKSHGLNKLPIDVKMLIPKKRVSTKSARNMI